MWAKIKSELQYLFHWKTAVYLLGNAMLLSIPFILSDLEVIDGWPWLAMLCGVVFLMDRNIKWMKSFRIDDSLD